MFTHSPAMKTRIQQWGNSLAVRIPKAVSEQMGVSKGSSVELILSGRTVQIEPLEEQPIVLEDLIAGIKPSNIHAEVDLGARLGNEVW